MSQAVLSRKRPWDSSNGRNVKRACIDFIDSRGEHLELPTPEDLLANRRISPNPYDKNAFLNRVYTYSPARWFGLPEDISAYECARWGWVCESRNKLRCSHCQNSLLFVGNRSNQLVFNVEVARFKEKMCSDEGHASDCLWLRMQSPTAYKHLPSSQIEMEEEFMEHLKTFNVTDGFANTYNLPELTEECKQKLLKELPNQNLQDEVTDAMMLAACGWKLTDTRKTSFCPIVSESDRRFNSEFFRLSCNLCSRSLPFKLYRMQSHNAIIPDSPRLRLQNLRISEPIISPFSIDNPPPAFGATCSSLLSFNFWGLDAKMSRKRKLSDDEQTEQAVKKTKINSYSSQIQEPIGRPRQIEKENNERKRNREEDAMDTDLGEPEQKKRKMEMDVSPSPPQESIIPPTRGRKRKNDINLPIESKRRRTIDGVGAGCFPKALDAISEHRPSCPYNSHYFYPTGSGEVPGWIHSIRCMQLDPSILKALMSPSQ